MPANLPCPCGSSSYSECCGIYHAGAQLAPNAEKLMRSRYSAYVLKNESYLLKTWHKAHQPIDPLFDANDKTQWLGLTIKSFQEHSHEPSATVEFVAIYKVNGKAHRIHEISNFALDNGQWIYIDGVNPEIK
jgi:SEC-C motif-containing protein